nr:MAG TPA: hypothetical protein [Caudoviricetes sp.]
MPSTSGRRWLSGVKSRTLRPTAWQAARCEGPARISAHFGTRCSISANVR